MSPHNAHPLVCLLFAFCLLFAAPVLQAAEVTVVSLKGRCESRANKEAEWKAIRKDQKLGADAYLRTYDGAEVVLAVGKRGVVTVHELSTLVIRRLDGKDEAPQSTFALLVGMIWNRWNKSDEKDNSEMIIETPAAVASIRGTTWYVESDAVTKESRIGVWEGKVGVVPARVRDRERLVEGGNEIIVLYNKLLVDPVKMEAERIQREQRFNEQIESLGLAALFPAVGGIAQINEVLVNETETTVKDINLRQRGEKIVAEDVKKFKAALAKMYGDTQFVPGEGFNKAAGSRPLLCLTKNDDGRGNKIPGWNGPYMDTDFKDPFGGEYTLYQKKNGTAVFLMLTSLGLDKVISDDDLESLYNVKAMERDSKN